MITPEGDYLSNIVGPDLREHFKHLHWRVMPHSQGHLVASDWADVEADHPFGFYKNCGLWTRDETAILSECASRAHAPWLDIGAHTGWTSKHINWASNSFVECVDPMLRLPEWRLRWTENTGFPQMWAYGETSRSFFARRAGMASYAGVCIDGDHEPGEPLLDAQGALEVLRPSGIVMFHDFLGQPVREAALFLMDAGFKCRVYQTPHFVACCWRGDVFTPPIHEPDPRVNWKPHLDLIAGDFPLERCV